MLSDRDHHAEHVFGIGLAEAPDRDIWRYAIEHGAVIVTKDEDFPDMVALSPDPPAVVWLRVGNTRRQALLDWFEPQVSTIVELLETGNRLIELR